MEEDWYWKGEDFCYVYWISQGGHTFEMLGFNLVTSLSHLSNNSVLVTLLEHFSIVLF